MAKFNISGVDYEFAPAEVVEVNYSDKNPELFYSILVRVRDFTSFVDKTSDTVITARPLNVNSLRVPLVGEIVLLLKSLSSESTQVSRASSVYYLDVISLQGNVHHNSLPTVATVKQESGTDKSSQYTKSSGGVTTSQSNSSSVDSDFSEKTKFDNLQHFVGDYLIQSRYGSSLRLGSTLKSYDKFSSSPNWSEREGSPITVFRNTSTTSAESPGKFSVEDFDKDDTTLLLSSGQNLKFKESSDKVKSAKKYGIDTWKKEKWGSKPIALITSGRVVLNARSSELFMFGSTGVGISTKGTVTIDAGEIASINANKIELGTESKEPLTLGLELKKWLSELIDDIGKIVITTPQGPASPINTSPQWPIINLYKSKIDAFLSDTVFTSKKTTS